MVDHVAEEEPTARITLTTVYKEVQDLSKAVITLTERLPNHIEATELKLADHERRIRQVESRIWLAVGAFGLIAAASPYLSRIIIP